MQLKKLKRSIKKFLNKIEKKEIMKVRTEMHEIEIKEKSKEKNPIFIL